MKRVLVIWEDACDIDDGPWTFRKDAAKSEPTIFHQVGFLCELTHEAVVLTAAVGEHQMGTRSRIPAGMVKSLIELTEGPPIRIPKKGRNKA